MNGATRSTPLCSAGQDGLRSWELARFNLSADTLWFAERTTSQLPGKRSLVCILRVHGSDTTQARRVRG